ncbi:MAG: PAS domain-containing protein [Bryobacteraceae bacterium]
MPQAYNRTSLTERLTMCESGALGLSGHFMDREARAILDAIAEAFIVLDAEWRIIYVNPAAARVNQKPAVDFLGKTLWEEWPSAAGSEFERQYRLALREQRIVHFEDRYVAPGYDVWLEVRAYPFRSGLAISYRDVTDRKVAEEQGRLLEERLRQKIEDFETLFQSMPVGLAVSEDPECREIRVNSTFADLLGISTETNASKSGPEAGTLPFRTYCEGRELTTEELPQQRAQRECRPSPQMELELVRRDGVAKFAYGSAVPLFNCSGEVRGSIGAFVDITDRKTAERALRESEERYRSLVSATSAFVWIADEKGEFSIPQPSWEAYTGQTWEEYRATGWIAAVHPEDRLRIVEAWRSAVATKSVYVVDWRAWHAASREWRYCWTRAVPVLRPDGIVREWIGAVSDVHDRKILESKLQHDAKLESLGVLAGGVAHDFNNLLVGILGNASFAVDEAPAPLRPVLQEIVSAAERAADLTRQMLAYAGKTQFVFEALDISREVREVLALVRSSFGPSVRVDLDLSDDLPALRADRGQIQQIVMNLLINAAEALPASGGNIRVGTSLDTSGGRSVVLTVQDNGTGMTAEVKARIFDPFFTTKFMGRGLGLAAVMGIVQAHRGSIGVDSLPGQGTTFRVFLPVSDEPAMARGVPARVEAGRSAQRTILVVDDEEVVRRVAQSALERAGMRAFVAGSGYEAVRVFRNHASEIDVVLLDVTLPDLGGPEVLRAIRQVRPGIPVLVSSGHPASEVDRYFTHDAPSGFLQKPYRSSALVAAVAARAAVSSTSEKT